MRRNVEKYINEYKRLFYKDGQPRKASFIMSEYKTLSDISSDKFELVDNSIMFAFMVGYKYGMSKKG